MKYRIGTCSACQAVYKVPASFSHDSARCRSCGEAVAIGPVEEEEAPAAAPAQAAAPAPKPAVAPRAKAPAVKPATKAPTQPVARKAAPAKPAAAPKPAPKPAAAVAPEGLEEVKVDPNKVRTGPSMKEKILARKRAEAEAAKAAAAKPAAQAAPKPAAKPAPKATPAKAAAAKPAAAKPSAKPAAAKRSGGGSRRRAAPAKKKSAMPALMGIGGLVIVAGGALFMFKDDLLPSEPDEVQAADATQVAAAESATPNAADPVADPAAGESSDPATAEDADPAVEPETDPEPVSLLDDEPEEHAGGDDAKPEISASQEALLDLTTLAVYDKVDDTTQEEWDEMNELMLTFLDEEAGAAGNRARNKLRDIGRKAFPVILNNLRPLDLTTPLGRQSGMLAQRLLSEIVGGNNYGWRDAPEKTDAIFNAKVVRKWHSEWANAESDVEYWIRMAKLNDEEADLLRAKLGAQSSGGEEEEDPFDLDF